MNHSPRRIVDVLMGLVVATIALIVVGQVLLQVMLQYMFQMIIAGAVVLVIWILVREVLAKRLW